jgi:hypothetical protein
MTVSDSKQDPKVGLWVSDISIRIRYYDAAYFQAFNNIELLCYLLQEVQNLYQMKS